MSADNLPKNSPLAHFQQSKADHATIESRVTGSYGDLSYEPATGFTGLTIFRKADEYTDRGIRTLTLNVKELNWLYDQLTRVLGR